MVGYYGKIKMTKNLANKIYDILVQDGGATEHMRTSFIYHHAELKEGCDEWRFVGKLGYGGKYRNKYNTVDCYTEDETIERLELIKEINKKLTQLNIE